MSLRKTTTGKWARRSGIMLAQPMDEKLLDQLFNAGLVFVQPKLDGDRCRAVWSETLDRYVLYSSEENVIKGAPHIEKALGEWREHILDCELIPCNEFDGELYVHGKPHERIHGLVSRQTPARNHTDLQYHIFDLVEEGTFETRLNHLSDLFLHLPPLYFQHLRAVSTNICARYNLNFWQLRYAENHFEGLMLRSGPAPYQRKRVKTLLKWKPKQKDWYEIREVIEAISETGAPLGRAGALLCVDDMGTEFSVGCGLGITHEDSVNFWNQREELIGRYAEVQYQCITAKNKIPRFGKFIDIVAASGEARYKES